MRVLIVHNRYRSGSPSGENRVVDQESALLSEAAHHVQRFERLSDDIAGLPWSQKALVPARVVWSPSAARDLERVIEQFAPDGSTSTTSSRCSAPRSCGPFCGGSSPSLRPSVAIGRSATMARCSDRGRSATNAWAHSHSPRSGIAATGTPRSPPCRWSSALSGTRARGAPCHPRTSSSPTRSDRSSPLSGCRTPDAS